MKKLPTLLLASLPGTLLAQGNQPNSGTSNNSLLIGLILLLIIGAEWYLLYKRAKNKARPNVQDDHEGEG